MDEGTLNDLLECSVCLERLDTSSKVLPCQHTFCRKCLNEIVSKHKELRCPECRVLVTVRVEDLPPNVLLMRILEGMKNAPNTQNKLRNGRGGTPHQLIHHTVNQSIENIPEHTVLANKLNSLQIHHQPYAKALYDYAAKEIGDLTFKRGDTILLKRRIDSNWYYGECNGQQGVFPLSYVQIITPVPSHLPQCKALYDFRMTNDDEEGCLAFKKGDVINVIRRVDENWAEGKLDGKIGIFPLAFVELNNLARSLMKLSTNVQPGPSKVAPPTPTNEENATPLIPTDHTKTLQPPSLAAKALPASDSSSTISSGGSSTTPNVSSSNNSSSSSSTTPSSPASPLSRAPPQQQQNQGTPSRNFVGAPELAARPVLTSSLQEPTAASNSKEKRHSFTGGVSSSHHNHASPHNHHRLSAEITASTLDARSVISTSSSPSRRTTTTTTESVASVSAASTSSSSSSLVQLPAAYVALYPYKPRKSDELELKKGGVYTVTDRCQDGWFKGTSNRTQKCGVFPGNYVCLARGSGGQSSAGGSHSSSDSKSVSRTRHHHNGGNHHHHHHHHRHDAKGASKALGAPPELPPRSVSPDRQQDGNVAAAASKSQMGRGANGVVATSSQQRSLNNASAACVVAASATANHVTKSEKSKERKERITTVGLMKRLASIKRPKSPPNSSYSMDNPVFEDAAIPSSIQPVHVRSGSCPSQLLQVPNSIGVVDHHRLLGTSSQRLKHKERPSVLTSHRSVETPSSDGSPEVQHRHRKSNSLDAGSRSTTSSSTTTTTKTSTQTVREKYRCIAPYPPNSEYELELHVADIIYVHKKRDDGWYKGTQQRTGKTGLFPASFVEEF